VFVLADRIVRGALAALLLLFSAACTEDLTTSLGCPQACGDQSAVLRDTTLTGVVVQDSVLLGYPLLGFTKDFPIVAQGDTADVRLVMRFDTLPNKFRNPNASVDSTVTKVDSSFLTFVVDTAVTRFSSTSPVTIDAYDVDTNTVDSLRLELLPLFRPDRKIGSITFASLAISDTLRLRLSDSVVLAKALAGAPLRIGLQVRSAQPVQVQVSGSTFTPRVTFRMSPDTLVATDTVPIVSRTPAEDEILASVYGVYPIVALGALPPPPAGVNVVGGVTGARTYLRFDVPSILVDSVQVVRASLLLQQVPSRVAANAADSMAILVNPILAGSQITDVATIVNLSGPGISVGVDSARLVPGDAGLKSVELVTLFRIWRAVGPTNSIRGIVLRAKQEAANPAELDFVSSEGPVDQQPRLRITYVPRRGFGLP
jgi:hypothetical protein